jgi:ribonuclease Z
VHDATFCAEEAERARQTFQSTAAEAARIAAQAGARRLVLTHISARYSANTTPLEREASVVFPGTVVAHDGMVVEIGYPDDPATELETPLHASRNS